MKTASSGWLSSLRPQRSQPRNTPLPAPMSAGGSNLGVEVPTVPETARAARAELGAAGASRECRSRVSPTGTSRRTPAGAGDNATSGCSLLSRVITSLCAGLLLCILGVVSYTTFSPILEQQVKANLVIDPSNEMFESWMAAPIPIFAKMYLFNYTNDAEILAGGRPRVQQVGPFVYRERRKKVNITFHNNGTVSYRQISTYEFLPELSNGSLTDEIVTLNVPMIAAAYRNRKEAETEEQQLAIAVEDVFKTLNQTIFIKKKVEELLFAGYNDSLLSLANSLGWSPVSRFGYQFGRNNSDDGEFRIFTGAAGMHNYGSVDSWRGGRRAIGYRRTCSFVNGTSGEMWPPYSLGARPPLVFFVAPLCRSLRLNFRHNDTVKGIRVLRYHLDSSLFNYTYEPNQCFCPKKKGKAPECPPDGLLDINKCQPDAPLAVSLPHLFQTSTAVSNFIDGLNPDEDAHSFFMDVEPTMGIPVRVAARLQMNVLIEAFKYFPSFASFTRRLYLPTFWTETTATVDDGIAFKIRLVTEDLASYVTYAAIGWVLIGLLVILCTLVYVIIRTRKSTRPKYEARMPSPVQDTGFYDQHRSPSRRHSPS